MDKKVILSQAIQKFGLENQQKQCVEECCELSTALLHHQRGKCDEAAVVTEIADVLIMCEQMKLVYGEKAVDDEVERKMNRLRERLGYATAER